MKTLLTILLSALCFSNLIAQSSEDSKYLFPTSVFNSNLYKPVYYPKFEGPITTTGTNYYQFGSRTLRVSLQNTAIIEIFKRGIFNPDIVFGHEKTVKTQLNPDTLSQIQRVFYNLTRNDSLLICCFEQLERLNPNPQTRRFKFWVFRKGVLNPTEYYLELQYGNATQQTPLKEFLTNAIMTFYHKGTIII